MGDSKQNRRRTNGLVALSSVAVMTVYTAGFFKTRAAADQLEGEAARRRTAAPVAVVANAAPAPAAAVEPTLAPPPEPASPILAAAPAPDNPETVIAPAPTPAAAAAPAATPAVAPATTKTPAPAPTAEAPVPAAAPKAAAAPVIAAAPAAVPVAPIAEVVAPSAPAAPAAAQQPSAEGAAPAVNVTTPPKPGDAVPIAYKDGKYYGWGSCRHGRIQARVIIEGGRITASAITKCETRYDCSWIKALVPQVVQRQSAEVDYVTGATESADAFYYAVVEALNQAK